MVRQSPNQAAGPLVREPDKLKWNLDPRRTIVVPIEDVLDTPAYAVGACACGARFYTYEAADAHDCRFDRDPFAEPAVREPDTFVPSELVREKCPLGDDCEICRMLDAFESQMRIRRIDVGLRLNGKAKLHGPTPLPPSRTVLEKRIAELEAALVLAGPVLDAARSYATAVEETRCGYPPPGRFQAAGNLLDSALAFAKGGV